ncbi:hypothetical protein HERIO_290 [Hepatospora eriocheir]|uniref:Transmembrane protein n=1 Tax=Hepatospora eriocheir TaxID=1081669 RepID=A0A1X0QDW7_9MICR|nr:hypothetical protein HERIO_290 [Hepatospora eriocheir]
MRINNYQYSYQNPDLTRPLNNINQDSKRPFNQFHNNNQFYDNQIQQPQEYNDMIQFSKNNTPSKNEKPSSSFCSIWFSTKTRLFLILVLIIPVFIFSIYVDKIEEKIAYLNFFCRYNIFIISWFHNTFYFDSNY